MSYQVFARKWRPNAFETMIGQEHVIRSLTHALNEQRIHQAYLFVGIQGIGKTTVARIVAKCLNCEQGISATPCGQCSACQEIDAGKFVDLIEIDAASHTKVEDIRELLENVQYVPSYGRFKIYLIDEVHMLSGHSFNALLKTLEEPPPHVKFLLATTDPQKLPVTVLSRCLQFNLRKVSPERIAHYLEHILQAEKLPYDLTAIEQIAQSANGSVRDALSLLEQGVSFSKGSLNVEDVSQMLGVVNEHVVEDLIAALIAKDAPQLLKLTAQLTEQGADFGNVLEALLTFLHRIVVAQVVPDAIDAQFESSAFILEISKKLSKEDAQLFYQIALFGRRDLPLASSDRQGFEMTLLRMLAFQPVDVSGKGNATLAVRSVAPAAPAAVQSVPTPEPIKQAVHSPAKPVNQAIPSWGELLSSCQLSGMTYALASNCELKTLSDGLMQLVLDSKHAALLNDKVLARLNDAVSRTLNQTLRVKVELGTPTGETPAQTAQRLANEKQVKAVKSIEGDPLVQKMVNELGASVDASLIKPLGE
ncbi:MAG: DNA polymerase III subunit gamma/tau [Pseudomonadota bacterium]|nr:DNA polymerase III subunit gamma/tau [Gammaproteobacteria bacterium]MBU1628870.1 DNA polymerase III subunit gamma/tau [Gammaproteobacteria bacterium]MBU2545957.1 DNA polymerase III subunit gamma/tau [Gammaproteobacteria bacterium]